MFKCIKREWDLKGIKVIIIVMQYILKKNAFLCRTGLAYIH